MFETAVPLALLLALVAAPIAAGAQGVLTKAPALLEAVEAEYPPEARAAGITGEVVLTIDIGADGSVLDAQVIEPAGHGFDEAALEAVRAFRFSPAEIDDVPTAVQIEYRYRFFFREEPPPPAEPAEEAPLPVNLRGVILERGNRRPLVGATVDVANGFAVVRTDAEGAFEVAGVPEGEVEVVVLDPAYERFSTTETIEPGRVTEVKYYVYRASASPYELVVVGKRERKEVSTVAISAGELTKLPGVSGDTVKVVQNLPGVARPPFGSGRIVVRGGDPEDTRAYVDGQLVPLLFHFGGVTSVYASELVDEVQFEPGNFGARYGRATAGRIELVTRPPAKERLHLVADVDLFDATGLAEGPVAEDVTVAIAARRSYVDAVIAGAEKVSPESFEDVGFSIAPRYYDYQGKIAWQAGPKDRLSLDVYGSSDKLALVGVDTGIEGKISVSTSTAFTAVGVTWDRQLGPDTRTKLQIFPGWRHQDFFFDPLFLEVDSYDVSVRADGYHDLSPALTLGAGLDLMYSWVKFEAQVDAPPPPGQIPSPDYRDNLVSLAYDQAVVQPALWTEAVWQPVPGLKLVPGLRVDHDTFFRATWVDPRFTTRWTLSEETTLKGSVGLYHQPPQPQYGTVELGNPDLQEEGAIQYGLGIEQRIAGPLGVDVQLYYKDLFDMVIPSNRVIVRDGERVRERYANEGTGRSYGAELLLRYEPDGRFFGWIAYSISRTERDKTVVGGMMGPSGGENSDQPHNLVALGTLELPEIWRGLSFGFRLRYATGNPFRPAAGGVYDVDTDGYRRIPGTSTARLPDFFQLDLRVDKKWTFEESSLVAYADVQNVTNRENIEGVEYKFDYSRWAYSPGLPIFPSIGLRYEY
ncbi:MAG TPA: TonB-dependent receptor [Vulgatibacter sp.]|nr:TonB-dependent receptor [Vulgatibacter sp.]